jgi:hypothetical protein
LHSSKSKTKWRSKPRAAYCRPYVQQKTTTAQPRQGDAEGSVPYRSKALKKVTSCRAGAKQRGEATLRRNYKPRTLRQPAEYSPLSPHLAATAARTRKQNAAQTQVQRQARKKFIFFENLPENSCFFSFTVL